MKPSTTHVIEIETGIGEPAFIPLTVGQELQPISVGKKGMWKIESARVLDVHAFVYFDGTSLFLQSADESASASVDGYKVGKAWTELHAPCKIEIGAARLRFRSLLAGAEQQAPPQQAAAGGGGGRAQTAALGVPRAVPSPPVPDRPFAHGELATGANAGEATRVPSASGSRPSPNLGMTGGHRPAMTGPVLPADDNATRMEGSSSSNRRNLTGPVESTMGVTPVGQPGGGAMMQGVKPIQGVQAYPQGMAPGMQMGMGMGMQMQPGMGMGMPPQMMPMGTPPPGYGQQPYGSMPPMGSMPPQQGGGEGLDGLLAKYKELPPLKRILLILAPFCVLSSMYLILFDEPAPPPPPITARDAGAAVASAVKPPPVPTPISACPPGFIPYPVAVQPGQQIPCVPAGTPIPGQTPPTATAPTGSIPVQPATAATPTPTPTPAPTPTPTPHGPADAGGSVAVAPAGKTLERQAVDAVAVNNYAAAASYYEQLQAQNPANRVYAEAARILRAKANAGAGTPPQ